MSEVKTKYPRVQSAVLTGPQDVPAFMLKVIKEDRDEIVRKLLEIADADFQLGADEDFPGLTREMRQNAAASIKVFALFFASVIETKPLPEFQLATMPLARSSKEGVTH